MSVEPSFVECDGGARIRVTCCEQGVTMSLRAPDGEWQGWIPIALQFGEAMLLSQALREKAETLVR